ncbi:hypothetical protein DSO57_1008227 [Entomophthora muscae]|uniref:Uncharacterized protein n=1 Tax=Entomophthora muscae TaxID=34485 RepID=A0ACC2SW21_9FUNG|nr:hypothetical protein DSO57_1008227 [Entomophthora muscae]
MVNGVIHNKERDDSILVNRPETVKVLVIDYQVNYANDEPLFLQHKDLNEVEDRMIIYIFNHIWVIHVKSDEKFVPLIYFLMTGIKQENYVCSLKIIKKEMQKIVLEEQ